MRKLAKLRSKDAALNTPVLCVADAQPGVRPRGEAMGAAVRVDALSCDPVVADCLDAAHQPSQPTLMRRVRSPDQ